MILLSLDMTQGTTESSQELPLESYLFGMEGSFWHLQVDTTTWWQMVTRWHCHESGGRIATHSRHARLLCGIELVSEQWLSQSFEMRGACQ